MGMVFLEGTGPNAEQLALKAGDELDIPVGWDSEFNSATFDSDAHDEDGLKAVVTQKLSGLDPDWEQQLRFTD